MYEQPSNPTLLIFDLAFFTGSGLECYVCHDQDGNHGKCLKTIRTCEPEQDRCLSIIRWSIQPYWSQVRACVIK